MGPPFPRLSLTTSLTTLVSKGPSAVLTVQEPNPLHLVCLRATEQPRTPGGPC